jgi:hypothetical protein
MAEKVNLFFFPELQDGVDEEVVKAKLAKTLSVDLDKVESWYASAKPTIILKSVDQATAGKYVSAIRECGAKCDTQEVGSGDWSLEQMTAADIHDYFICPSCEYEEELERGDKIEQCPKCGLVIAKWEEKMREEAEKEKIRRRLLRDQRLVGDREAEMEKKREELERLRRLEREIMAELGIRPPSKLWIMFENHPVSIGFVFTAMIIIGTGFAFRYADQHFEELAAQELLASQPSEEVQQLSPVITAAAALQQNGNQQMVTELADATGVMRGQMDSREAIVDMAQNMMKGADAATFINNVSQNMSLPQQTAKLSDGEVSPAPVNIDTIGGVSGLTGMASFAPDTLAKISPPLLEHGHENVLTKLSEKRLIPDPIDPEAPGVVVEAIDEMDGSKLIDLMNTLTQDQEWDQYLLGHVRDFLAELEFDRASDLTNRIQNPVVRIGALTHIMVARMENGQSNELKVLRARARVDLDRVKDVDTKAKLLLDIGRELGFAGVKGEPGMSIGLVEGMASDSGDLLSKAGLHARIAVAYIDLGNRGEAKRHFASAQNSAGRLPELQARISALRR